MKRSGTVNRIRQYAAEGQSIRQIAHRLGISRNTVKKYLTTEYDPKRAAHKSESKLDDYKPFVKEQIQYGNLNCVNLLQQIRTQGYDGSLTILKDYVRPLRPAKCLPAVVRFETLPGQQAQMDWGIALYMDEEGVVHKVAVLVVILGYSRTMYVEFVKRCDEDSLLRCLVNAFEFFGGVPREILTDRMKTVLTAVTDDGPVWHGRFEDFAAVMGFVPKVCRARRPQTKGKVERGVRFLKESFLPGRRFTDIDDLNSQARQWCIEKNRRVHSSTGKAPQKALTEETLLPLPSAEVLASYRWQGRKVSKDGFVSFEGVLYGVPWEYSGKEVSVRQVINSLEIWHGSIRIAYHKKECSPAAMVWLEGQYIGIPDAGVGMVASKMALLIKEHSVESRPLAAYEKLVEVAYD